MKKRLFTSLLSLCLIFSLLSAAALAADDNGITEPVNATREMMHEGHEAWTDLSTVLNENNKTATLSEGKYYLEDDLVVKALTITDNVTICLNGHELKWGIGQYDTSKNMITVSQGATLNMCDCAAEDERGKVSGINYNGALVFNEGILNLYQVHFDVTGNTKYSGAVYNAPEGTAVIESCYMAQPGFTNDEDSTGLENYGSATVIDTKFVGFGISVLNDQGTLTMNGCVTEAPYFTSLLNSSGQRNSEVKGGVANLTDCILAAGVSAYSSNGYDAVYNGGTLYNGEITVYELGGKMTLTDCEAAGITSDSHETWNRGHTSPKNVTVTINGGTYTRDIYSSGQLTITGATVNGTINATALRGSYGARDYEEDDYTLTMQNVTVTYDSKIGTFWDAYCVSMDDGVMDIENCTVNSVTGGISANSCDAEIVNCNISVDNSSLEEEIDSGFVPYGYAFAGIFVSGTSEDDVSITGGSIKAEGISICGINAQVTDSHELTVQGTEIEAPVGVYTTGKENSGSQFIYINGTFSPEYSQVDSSEPSLGAVILDRVQVTADKYGVESANEVKITGNSTITGGETGLYNSGRIPVLSNSGDDPDLGQYEVIEILPYYGCSGGTASISNSSVSGGKFAVYSASPKYYDYKKYASGDQAEFDFTNYPEVLEAVTKDLDKTVYLGENVTLSGGTAQLGSDHVSGLDAQITGGTAYNGSALTVRYDGEPHLGDVIVENVTDSNRGLFALNFPEGWGLKPSESGRQLILMRAYAIDVDSLEHGSITADPSGEVAVNTEVELTVTPEEGYELKEDSLKVTYTTDAGEQIVPVTDNKFNMPAADVTVSAEFVATEYSITYELDGGANAEGNPDTYTVEQDITLSAPTRAGYTFTGWTWDGQTEPQTTVNLAAGSVTGDLTFTANWKIKLPDVPVIDPDDDDDDDDEPGTVTPDDTGVSDWLDTKNHIQYLSGYGEGKFGPEDNMTRAQAAQMFYNLLVDKEVKITTAFEDVPENAWYATPVNTLASLGIISGVGDNRFEPDRSITRAEFTALAMKFTVGAEKEENIFSDVNPTDWFYEAVTGSIQFGWIIGYGDGTFRPNNTITRAEGTAIVNKMLGREGDQAFIQQHQEELKRFTDVTSAHWAYYHIAEATNEHDYTKQGNCEKWSSSSYEK